MASACACSATASAAWLVPPTTVPGGKPVTALPGLTPRSPVTMVGPVLVTIEPPKTAKLVATPRGGAVASRGRAQAFPIAAAKSSAARVNIVVINVSCCLTRAQRPRNCPAKKCLVRLRMYPCS